VTNDSNIEPPEPEPMLVARGPGDTAFLFAVVCTGIAACWFLNRGGFFVVVPEFRWTPISDLGPANFFGGVLDLTLTPIGWMWIWSLARLQGVWCPYCDKRNKRPSSKAGPIDGRLTCRRCKNVFVVPSASPQRELA
jgi:hypothetical protein